MTVPTIELNSDGFVVVDEAERIAIEWKEVIEIFAFKLDLLSCDTIRLGFRVTNTDEFYEVDEDWSGYKALVAETENRFEVAEDWWRAVAFPAFAENLTTIWSAPSS